MPEGGNRSPILLELDLDRGLRHRLQFGTRRPQAAESCRRRWGIRPGWRVTDHARIATQENVGVGWQQWIARLFRKLATGVKVLKVLLADVALMLRIDVDWFTCGARQVAVVRELAHELVMFVAIRQVPQVTPTTRVDDGSTVTPSKQLRCHRIVRSFAGTGPSMSTVCLGSIMPSVYFPVIFLPIAIRSPDDKQNSLGVRTGGSLSGLSAERTRVM